MYFLVATAFSVLLRIAASDYPFGIVKHFAAMYILVIMLVLNEKSQNMRVKKFIVNKYQNVDQ